MKTSFTIMKTSMRLAMETASSMLTSIKTALKWFNNNGSGECNMQDDIFFII